MNEIIYLSGKSVEQGLCNITSGEGAIILICVGILCFLLGRLSNEK